MSRNLSILSALLSVILITEACVDVCRGRQDNHFASNPRGCAWYNRCNVGRPAEEGRCPEPFYFNYEKQSCDWQENVECTEANTYPTTCPPVGIASIPHVNVCSKYTGRLQLKPLKSLLLSVYFVQFVSTVNRKIAVVKQACISLHSMESVSSLH